jgi:hypothetical protein
MSKRQYKCEWPVGYDQAPDEIQGFDFFTTDLGYTGIDIDAIDDLLVGERHAMWGALGSSEHYVTRLEDKS